MKKTMYTKLMSVVLAAVLLLALAVPAMAADEDFVIKSTVLTKYNGKGGDVVIPDGVTEIGDRAFERCSKVTSVTIPNSVRKIGHSAFAWCSGLTGIDIPDSVTYIDSFALYYCTGITSVVVPSSVTTFGSSVFENCESLVTAEIKADLNVLSGLTFQDCKNLVSVNIPESVTSIGDFAFDGCSSLKNITIPSGVKKIGSFAFVGIGATSIDVPASVTEIEQNAFLRCSNLKSITIRGSLKSIANYAFRYCSSLTEFTVPSGVTEIGMGAFEGCSSLKSVTIPVGCKRIWPDAFNDCDSLTDVYYGGTQEDWKSISGLSDLNGINPLLRITIHYTEKEPEPTPAPTTTTSFSDVPAGAYYEEPVKWAIDKGITNGTGGGKFSPEKTCNTAEILTFLWRACGSPKVEAAGDFSDVAASAWYADAANWAKAQGMISGSTLSPDTPCTRASTVMFIWQAAGRPGAASPASFTDVPANADYAAAVAWAVENGVTTGTGTNTFSPDNTCTRGQIATFLYRAFAK